MNKKELWLKLRDYHFENLVPTHLWDHISAQFGGANAFTKAFAAKIAKKHGWHTAFAIKAIVEYKKFVYLGIVSDFQVTPSKYIDVVWHEHILFTRGYREFCDKVIEYTFDHSPELISIQDQTEEYNAQYADTIELYTTEFGAAPPEAIWGNTKYDKTKVPENNYTSRKKVYSADPFYSNSYISDAPLCSGFDGSSGVGSIDGGDGGFGGGSFGGAGAEGSWGDGDSGTGDSGSSDGGSDGGGSDGGGGCSSSCGGGGCGGGD